MSDKINPCRVADSQLVLDEELGFLYSPSPTSRLPLAHLPDAQARCKEVPPHRWPRGPWVGVLAGQAGGWRRHSPSQQRAAAEGRSWRRLVLPEQCRSLKLGLFP